MTLPSTVGIVLCTFAAVLAGLRWTRVAQREHYLAGSLSRFAWRWWARRPLGAGLATIGIGAAVASPFAHWCAFLTAGVVALGPPGLALRGRTSPLVWTRRCGLLAASTGALVAAGVSTAVIVGGLTTGLVAAAMLAALLPLLEDGVLAALSPVEDCLARRYVDVAARRLERVAPVVVAITGSYGKTTTKRYLSHLLGGRFAVVASPKSYNNRAGLTRTVNELLVPGTDVLVAEMGTYGPGEIAALCAWLRPRVAVLTAIGPVHLERFGTLDRTLAAKAEIAAGAAFVVCNTDDERLASLARALDDGARSVVRCSAGGSGRQGADVLVAADGEGGATIEVRGRRIGVVRLPASTAPGTLSNVACALGAALCLGCTPEELVGRVEGLPGVENRLEAGRTDAGILVFDDTFNANPAGARVALGELARVGANARRRVLVTPGMVELGSVQFEENEALGRYAAGLATDVVVVGRTNKAALLAGAARKDPGYPSPRVLSVRSRKDAVGWVRSELGAGDVVLYENDLPDHYP